MVIKTIASALSPEGSRGHLSILIFHRVLPQVDPIFPDEPDARRFADILSWISRWFQVIPLDQAIVRLQSGTLPQRAAAITFDDGYADNATVALPILQQYGLPATFFIATGFLNGGRMWNDSIIEAVRACRSDSLNLTDIGFGQHVLAASDDRRRAIDKLIGAIKYLEPTARNDAVARVVAAVGRVLPDDLMMTTEQLLALRRAGMQIGAHTRTHPILARLPDADARNEIALGKRELEHLLEAPVELFAYPNGKPDRDYQSAHVDMVREAGFAAAVSTAAGVASRTTDFFQLPRFSPWDRSRLRYGLRMLANLRMTKSATAMTPHLNTLRESSVPGLEG